MILGMISHSNMRMRLKPIRGEKILHLPTGLTVTLLETVEKDYVKAIFPTGKINAVRKDTLNLPIINTHNYEKLPSARA